VPNIEVKGHFVRKLGLSSGHTDTLRQPTCTTRPQITTIGYCITYIQTKRKIFVSILAYTFAFS